MLEQALEAYLKDYREVFHHPTPPPFFSPEDQLKVLVRNLFRRLGLEAFTEVSHRSVGRPDLGIFQGTLLVGYVELKAPGKSLDPRAFTGHDRKQWERFKHLPNLIYSDGLTFLLYREGELLHRAELSATGPSPQEVGAFEALLLDFKSWGLAAPKDPHELAQLLAPIARYLREEALEALEAPPPRGESLKKLYEEWRRTFLPGADQKAFADAFAQLLTYAFLLARLEWDEARGPFALENILAYLQEGHSLLMDALFLANHPLVIQEIYAGYHLLRRALAAVDPKALAKKGAEPWLYFYEDFLAAYDPELRKDLGVYYTPKEVVGAMVRLVDDLLKARLGRKEGLAHEGVTVLDPALGTGTFLLGVLERALENAEALYGPGFRGSKATEAAQRLFGFELMLGPYAVAQFRLSRAVREEGGELPEGGLKVYLTDTLEDPYGGKPLERLGMVYERLAEEHERASRVKREEPILVVLGNPPYDRVQGEGEEERRKRAGWLLQPRDPENGQSPPLLEDFLKPLETLGLGVHAKNLYNLYVYFWRWALWKALEQDPKRPGMVAFITASSYLGGPGFAGMRAHMRQVADEIYILDLGGEGRGAVKEENVFNIQTPVAIALLVRYGKKEEGRPARVFYHRVPGATRQAKLAHLAEIESLEQVPFQEVGRGLYDPFLPELSGAYATWPKLTDLFPWQHSGVEFKRTWPIGPTRKVLEERWYALLTATDLKAAFREERDRRVDRPYPAILSGEKLPPLSSLSPNEPPEAILRYGHRSLDRAWAIVDGRVCSYPRPALWRVQGPKQVFLTSLLGAPLGEGPALTATPYVPDLHHFCNRGGKDVIPLYRDREGRRPNLAPGLLELLEDAYGFPVAPEDFLAYVYALLAQPAFTARFQEEVRRPPVRVPLTKEGTLFQRGVELGRRLLCCHTFGERFGGACALQGKARWQKAPSGYPQDHAYDPQTQTLEVGDGEVAPVAPEVWAYSISGFQPLKAWLDYRIRGAGKKGSPLDGILPATWSPDLSRELLEVVWALECSLSLHPEQEALLEAVLAGPLFREEELPQPGPAERKPPEEEPEAVGEAVQDRLL